ncbi:hypothetical protein G9A89_022338 [Geosiphon pyriformis]|nr:hypothetical protein G9A89_022338 [Geosiphon pyriformis]
MELLCLSFLRLDSWGPVSYWFDVSVCFLNGFKPSFVCNLLLPDIDGSLSGLDTSDIKASAAVFFKDINLSLGVEVSRLVSSTMVELQAIALALECVPLSHLVNLFSDSQAALDVCKFESMLICPDFRNWCWIKYCHITNVICHKNLVVNWIKVKGHFGVLGNKCADAFAGAAALFDMCLPYMIDEHFLRAGGTIVSVHAKHWAVIEKGDLILHNGFVSVSISGFSLVLLASMVRLLGIVDVFGVSFGFHKSCLFFSDISDMVSSRDKKVSQAATQHILNVASEFFQVNNISINNDKTVAIPINCRVSSLHLLISGLPISIAKRGEPHWYLGIFLSTEGLSKPSLAKAHLDVRFFTNLVLRKAISDKQFSYLVSAVLHPIVVYRTQFSFVSISVYAKWDAMIHKDLKSKSGLPLNFPNDAIHYPSLYELKSFEQIQAESKSAAVVCFANSVGILDRLFTHRSHNLQVLSWRPCHPLLFPSHINVSPLNNFLAGVVRIFLGCDLSLGGLVTNLCDRTGSIFKWWTFKRWKKLNPRGPIPDWFNAVVRFLSGSGSSPVCSLLPLNVDLSDVLESCEFDVVCNCLLEVDSDHLFVFMDGFLCGLGTLGMKAGAVVFFENIDLGLGVEVSGLVSSTMTELQAIALALKCVPPSCSVNLFSDSQTALDACRSELMLGCPDFRNWCWVKCCHISNVIHHKNLDVDWIKVRGHSGVLGNERADTLARTAVSFGVHLPYRIDEHFLKAGSTVVFGNSRHFVRNVFHSIHHAHWEVGSGSRVLVDSLCADVDWFRSCSVWHPDSHLAAGFTNAHTTGFRTYFMKTLHHHLPVAVRKHLYDKGYPSVMCLFCGNVKISNHVFSCSFNAGDHARLMNAYASVWEMCSSLSHSTSYVLQSLSACTSNAVVGAAIYKNFDSKTAAQNIVAFVHDFCLAFCDNIWLVRVKHRAVMEKSGLIPRDGSIPVSVSGLPSVLSSSVVRLLGIADAISIGFGFRKSSLFFSGIGNLVLVYIGA